jgi:hypothetical protein
VGVAQLGQDGRGGDGADAVVGGDQRPAAWLAAGQRPQPLVDRVQLGVQVVDLAQRHGQRLPASRGQRHLLQPAAGGP